MIVLLVAAVALCLGAGSVAGQPDSSSTGRRGVSSPAALAQLLPGSTPAPFEPSCCPKLDSSLQRVVESDSPLAMAERLGYRVRDGRVQVYVKVVDGATDRLAAWLEDIDAAFVSAAYDIVQAHVAVESLPLLDARPEVKAVRRPTYLADHPPLPPLSARDKTSTGDFVSEGLAAMNGPAWHADSFTGQGIKIGLIDTEFGDTAAIMGTELPGDFGFWQCPSCQIEPGKHHGSACAEIIMDIVPDASLYAAQVATTVDVVNAAQWLRSQDVDVISGSVAESAGPGDGTGDMHSEIASFTSAGGLWAVPAGDFHDNHWQSQWVDSDGNSFIDTSADIDCTYVSEDGVNPAWVVAGTTIEAELIWNQWSSPETNLDFVLVYQAELGGAPVEAARSSDLQSGLEDQRPLERISHQTELDGYYCLAVVRAGGPTDVDVEIFTTGAALAPGVPQGSLTAPADSPSALTVAAVEVAPPYALFSYSSSGPSNGPGGSLEGGQTKPDIAGYAAVTTASYAPQPFDGTAAACSHVAGAAALVWSAHPEWTNQQVRDYLEDHAVDIDPPGMDNDSGWGRLHLGDPPVSCDDPSTPGAMAVSSATVVSGAGYTVSWDPAELADWYELQEATDPTFSAPVRLELSETSWGLFHTVDSDTTFYYRVRAVRTCGSSSDWSTTASTAVTAVVCDPPSVPTELVASASSVAADTAYTISWSPSATADSYEIQEATELSFSDATTFAVNAVTYEFQHSPESDTTYFYRVRALRACGASSDWSDVVTVTVTAAGEEPVYTYMVPGIASAPGSGEAYWRSYLSLYNRSSRQANLTLFYRHSSGAETTTAQLPGFQMVGYDDVAQTLFGVAGSSSGAVEIQSDRPLAVQTRTYNDMPSGTFGQYLPGVSDPDYIQYGTQGFLGHLRGASGFRTHVGFVNPGTSPCGVGLRLYSPSGGTLGSAITVTVPAGGWTQVNNVFSAAFVQGEDLARATVSVTTVGGKVWAYASVIDALSGDPMTVPVIPLQ